MNRPHAHLLTTPDDASLHVLLERCGEEVTISLGNQVPERPIQVLVGGRPSSEQLAACDGLEVLVIPYAGVPPRTVELVRGWKSLAVHNLHHNAAATAEMAVTLLLAAAKRIVPMDRALRAGDWRPRYEPNPSVRLVDGTALVVGFGAIGQRVAGACQGLGMRVMATRRGADQIVMLDEVEIYPAASLRELLPEADAVIVCVPLTDETRGLLGKREFALMRKTAVLVNVGRGNVVDERALYDALRTGRLHGAGLDVWYRYPRDEDSRRATAPAGHPFHELDNVVMSPHRGGGAIDNEVVRMQHLGDLLLAIARGGDVPGRVDLGRGY